MSTITANWYDFPQYCDLAFRDETKAEANFIVAACQKYATIPVRRLLEAGCGSGRLITALAARGFDMVGVDLSMSSLKYLRQRLHRRNLRAELLHADMTDLTLSRPGDAAFCTFDTFRHLLTEKAARRHLQSVAESLRPGGIYILGFHLLPLDVSEESCERWRARQGATTLTATLKVIATHRGRRLETLRMTMRVRSPRRDLRVCSEFRLRMYTAAQFRRLLASVPEFRLCDVFDFWYEIGRPRTLTDKMTDTVFILRKDRPEEQVRNSALRRPRKPA
jgi:SAM-dependent methyltransferase